MKMPRYRRARGLYAPELLESRIAPATFIVTSLLDDGDTADKTTLREAIEKANLDVAKDTITFLPGLTGEIVLNGTDIDITGPLTIKGPGADVISVSGNATTKSRIFNINDNSGIVSAVAISGLTLRNGEVAANGGAILSEESLSLDRVVVTGNKTTGGGHGGALYLRAGSGEVKLTIKNSVFTGNTANGAGGAIFTSGLGGAMVISKTTFSGNLSEGGTGGALRLGTYLRSSPAIVDSSTFVGNAATGAGGAIHFTGSDEDFLVIKNTLISSNTATARGGGIDFESGNLMLTKSVISNNSASGGGGVADILGKSLTISGSSFLGNRATVAGGGGLYSRGDGAVSVEKSVFSGNTAATGGGAMTFYGPTANPAVVSIKNSVILGNTAAGSGGGIARLGAADLTLVGSVVSGNVAGTSGGGLEGAGGGGGGGVTVKGGRFEGNRSGGIGGGINTGGSGAGAIDLRVTGTLFQGNSAFYGGAVGVRGGSVTIESARVIGNIATYGGGGMDLGAGSVTVMKSLFQRNHSAANAGGLGINAATTLVSGSQFLDNTAAGSDGGLAIYGTAGDSKVLKSTISGNVAGGGAGGFRNSTANAVDLTGTKVTGNFSPTDTNLSGPVTNFTPTLAPSLAGDLVVTSLADDGGGAETTLREAIEEANTRPGKQTIVFDKTLAGQIVLNGADIDITGPLTIKGPGADFISISGNDLSRIFNIDDNDANLESPVAISGLAFLNGKATGDGGAILSKESLALSRVMLTLNEASGKGGGLAMIGALKTKFTVKESIFTGNAATANGGGLFTIAGDDPLISKTTVSGNTAGNGGGLYLNAREGKGVVDASVLIGNRATGSRGGGMMLSADTTGGGVTLKNTIVTGNAAATIGGGLYLKNGNLGITKSTISNNTAGRGGGVADNFGKSLVISGTGFFANRATDAAGGGGGGLYTRGDEAVSVQTSLFAGNTSASIGGAILVRGTDGDPAKVVIKGSSMLGNTAAGNGGGIASLGVVDLTVEKSILSGDAGSSGGGIFATGAAPGATAGGVLTVKGGRFEGNSGGGSGGGIKTEGSGTDQMDLTVAGTFFVGNLAGLGGGIDTLGGGAIKITGAKVLGNVATSGDGGGLYLRSTDLVSVTSTLFQGNRAKNNGGGLALNAASVLVTMSKFFDNTSGSNGGAIAIFGGEAGAVTKSILTGNVAGASGGAIRNATADPLDLTGSKVLGNFAPTDPKVSGPVL